MPFGSKAKKPIGAFFIPKIRHSPVKTPRAETAGPSIGQLLTKPKLAKDFSIGT